MLVEQRRRQGQVVENRMHLLLQQREAVHRRKISHLLAESNPSLHDGEVPLQTTPHPMPLIRLSEVLCIKKVLVVGWHDHIRVLLPISQKVKYHNLQV